MKIIISPAKQMKTTAEFPEPQTVPVFLEQAEKLRGYLCALSHAGLRELLDCNEKLATQSYEQFHSMDLKTDPLKTGTAALLAYDGIQYKYMAPHVFEREYFEYAQNHLRILSGFYGILKPLDSIRPYRLEMQAKLHTPFCRNLYDFWQDSICRELVRDEGEAPIVVNLASAEYGRAVEPYLPPKTLYLSCLFAEIENGKPREKGVYVKMARGEMVRYMAENRISAHCAKDLREALAAFNRLGFLHNPALSDEKTLVFTR